MSNRLARSVAIGAVTLGMGIGGGQAQPSGEITVWSWNIAAEALDMLVPDFNGKYPDVKVTVDEHGPQPTCATRRSPAAPPAGPTCPTS